MASELSIALSTLRAHSGDRRTWAEIARRTDLSRSTVSEVAATLRGQGLEPVGSSADRFAATISADIAKEDAVGFEEVLEAEVRAWLEAEWPFEQVRWPGRDISWEDWEALPDA